MGNAQRARGTEGDPLACDGPRGLERRREHPNTLHECASLASVHQSPCMDSCAREHHRPWSILLIHGHLGPALSQRIPLTVMMRLASIYSLNTEVKR